MIQLNANYAQILIGAHVQLVLQVNVNNALMGYMLLKVVANHHLVLQESSVTKLQFITLSI